MKRIAVYGTLRRGCGNYDYFLRDQIYRGIETLMLPFKMVSLGGFPGLVASEEVNPIVVEIYDIDEEAARGVDGLENYPRFYNRREVRTSFGDAWIYYLEGEQYNDLNVIVSGNWIEYGQYQNYIPV